MKADEPVITMNAAFATDGARLKISGTTDTPIELLFLATNADARTIATRTNATDFTDFGGRLAASISPANSSCFRQAMCPLP